MWQDIIVWCVVIVAFILAARYATRRVTKPRDLCSDCDNSECKMRGKGCDSDSPKKG
ncbi:MAG: hypothetical protein IKA49_04480 [Alistipes sp.]|nr:hypothetical protein [Alistipes sp.]